MSSSLLIWLVIWFGCGLISAGMNYARHDGLGMDDGGVMGPEYEEPKFLGHCWHDWAIMLIVAVLLSCVSIPVFVLMRVVLGTA